MKGKKLDLNLEIKELTKKLVKGDMTGTDCPGNSDSCPGNTDELTCPPVTLMVGCK